MHIPEIFIQRYNPLVNFYLADIWEKVPQHLLRERPHPRVNSIAWILWHITRCEKAGLNRFVVDGSQVLDDGGFLERLNLPWRHHGCEMTFPEVDQLDSRIDLVALHEYCLAVQERTRQIINTLDDVNLDVVMETPTLTHILVDEGLAHSNAEGFIKNYKGWSKAKCLMTFGLTHPYQHVGEIGVVASLLGVEFD
jgi:hypothetical protein